VRPNEFGTLVTIQESENQIITAYEVHTKRPADVSLWTPALDRHQATLGRLPDAAKTTCRRLIWRPRRFAGARTLPRMVMTNCRLLMLRNSGARRAGA
jgi:IS5 family transposase